MAGRIQNNSKLIKGMPLQYNAGLQRKYNKALQLLVKPMNKDVKSSLLKLFSDEKLSDYFFVKRAQAVIADLTFKWTNTFRQAAEPLSMQMVADQSKMSAIALGASAKSLGEHLSLQGEIVPPELKPKLEAVIQENVGLIKSIPQEFLQSVQGDVMRSVTTGEGLKSLKESLLKYTGEDERRALNIALDQTRKTYNIINVERMKVYGLDDFEWLHSGGSQRPRQYHIAMNGNIYSVHNPPVISAPGEKEIRGYPSQLIFCMCTMAPVYKIK